MVAQLFIFSYVYLLDFENVIAKWTFCVQQFFSAKNSKVAITEKLRMQLLPFFSSPPFLFLRYCDFGASRA